MAISSNILERKGYQKHRLRSHMKKNGYCLSVLFANIIRHLFSAPYMVYLHKILFSPTGLQEVWEQGPPVPSALSWAEHPARHSGACYLSK